MSTDLARIKVDDRMSEERQRSVVAVCVHAILETSAGSFIDDEKLGMYIDSRFEQMCDGRRFDFAPLLRALLKIDGVTEQDLYIGIVNLIGALAGLGIVMEEPPMSILAPERTELLQHARAATAQAKASFERRRLFVAVEALEHQKLGDLMVARGLIDDGQLRLALEAQAEHGGRLGTNLVEMGFVSPDQLARFLSDQLDLPCVTTIGNVAHEVLALVPADLAARHKVFPLRLEEHSLLLAMADPGNLAAIEEIEAASGRRVLPTIAPELVITYALARHYKVRQPMRIRHNAVPEPVTESVGEFAYDISDLAADFARADDLFDVLAMVQRFMCERFEVSAVFDVADGVVRGFTSSGIGDDPRAIRDRIAALGEDTPDEDWFYDSLCVSKSEELELLAVVVDIEPLAIVAGVRARTANPFGTQAEQHRLSGLIGAAIRMMELREEIIDAAGG